MEQMTGYALLGIGDAESPEMMHARVQEACTMAEKMLQNSIEMVEYKGKTMGEWVKSVKKLQQYEERLREVTKKVERLEAERDDAYEAICSHCQDIPCREGECYWYNKMRGAQKEE